MTYKEEIEKFVIKGFKNVNDQLITDNKHSFVLKNKKDNFIFTPPKNFNYHIWAGSLKSSQAFAYNVFSGVNDSSLEFEFPMEVFNRDAQIDVKIESGDSHVIELFEVKMFEICDLAINKILFEDKYFTPSEYRRSDIAEKFIKFLKTVVSNFYNERIYGGGIKQLCSHLLGIINIMDTPAYNNKVFKLYSFCFDNPFTAKFEKDIVNYKETLSIFKNLVDNFLVEIKVDARVDYCGFLSAKEYINENQRLLGISNYDYVAKRYFFN